MPADGPLSAARAFLSRDLANYGFDIIAQRLPESGPIVILSADKSTCNATVLMRGMHEPLLIPLPRMTYSRAGKMQQRLKAELEARGLRMREALKEQFGEGIASEEEGNEREKRGVNIESMLRELWESVVKPVLDALAFNTKSAAPSTRIWWCPTRPFLFLPIHAAGIYGHGTASECLSDYAVPSYTTNVSALTTRIREKQERKASDSRLPLLVSAPEAEGQKEIHGVRKGQTLLDFVKASGVNSLGLEAKEATVERMIRRISKSTVIRPARHDSQAVHPAAEMLASGFRGTISTMWAIQDAHAPKLAEDFYRDLLERGRVKGGGVDVEDAAFALHYAVQNLQKRLGGAEKSFWAWVPYIHFGL
ncbi:hypothetical protein BKA70DRAFT_404783 [Coprinopsis sp. MPI-PUGE-AT-0042]|nr:hypothetical protein BKA70DRAFT_404783 [Coprinopsis sp. MPI-PUGE-AT-0042]